LVVNNISTTKYLEVRIVKRCVAGLLSLVASDAQDGVARLGVKKTEAAPVDAGMVCTSF
jgi:hypothetical protein